MRQTWRRLTFLHWPYPPALIRALIPPELELDTFDGAAWIGLVPFEIYGTPGLPYFPETNVRTYVIGPDGSPAVWFFSLEAARLAAVAGARIAYHLSYFWARMRVTSENGVIRYESRRRWPHDRAAITDIRIQPGEAFGADELRPRDHFLTARYRLFTLARGRLASAEIEHEPWPLARAQVLELKQTLLHQIGLPTPAEDPLAHYSEEVTVRIGPLDLH
ncbi:MAG TPA: DUF2071 domain-containing protein [Bryobacteraceae bacterium]|nr:DUF2071 domain-containing protein [Bryobacteraceae bacterium]